MLGRYLDKFDVTDKATLASKAKVKADRKAKKTVSKKQETALFLTSKDGYIIQFVLLQTYVLETT